MVELKPLGKAEDSVFQLLLTLDSRHARILFDVGWDQTLDESQLTNLVGEIDNIDVILLTHATLGHLGAFAYLRHRYPAFRKIPAFATFPVVRMGQLLTLEVYRHAGLCGPFAAENTLDQTAVEHIFSEISMVNYSQPLELRGFPNLDGVTITAYNAGHSLGGTLWKVVDAVDAIIFAADWNHARDAHLSGAFLESKVGRVSKDLINPSILVTTSTVSAVPSFTKARTEFLAKVQQALDNNGVAFIPTSSVRMLELVLVLEEFLIANRLKIPLVLCSAYGQQTISQASSMLEWMVPSIITEWQVQNESPFETRKMRHARSISDIRIDGAGIVIVPGESLEQGLSRQLFFEYIASNPKNSLILTEPCPENTLGNYLLTTNLNPGSRLTGFKYKCEKPLTGEAYDEYMQRKQTERDETEVKEALEKRNLELIDASASAQEVSDDSDSDSDSESEFSKGHDFDAKTTPTYPYKPNRKRTDDYGDMTSVASMFKKRKQELDGALNDGDVEMTDQNDNNGLESDANGANTSTNMEGGSINGAASLETSTEPPMEIVELEADVELNCSVYFADMNGITNRRSLEMIVKQVRPAKVCAFPGNLKVCDWLESQSPIYGLLDKPVFYERTNFAVNVRVDASVLLDWRTVSNAFSVSRVKGSIELDAHDKNTHMSATLLPINSKTKTVDESAHKPMTLGDLRLATLRKDLNDSGFKAEFKEQNVLVCNDTVAIKQLTDNDFSIEGDVCEDYYTVRALMRKYITTI